MDYRETIGERTQKEPQFRKALLRQAIWSKRQSMDENLVSVLAHVQVHEDVNFELRARRRG